MTTVLRSLLRTGPSSQADLARRAAGQSAPRRGGALLRRAGWMLVGLPLFLNTPVQASETLSYGFRLLPATQAEMLPFACDIPAPLIDMSDLFAFYKPTNTQSEIDRERMKAYVKRLAGAKDAVKLLSRASRAAVIGESDRTLLRSCIMGAVRGWASRSALLDGLEENTPLGRRQANLEIAWTAIAFANALAVADLIEPISEADRALANRWFERLADELMANFSEQPREKPDRWLNTRTNQWLWGAAAVAALSVHLNDPQKLDWAMDVLRVGLDDARDDGGLPSELRRGERALHYQNYALTAMSQLLHFAAANGVELDEMRQQKLTAIVRFTMEAYNDPQRLESDKEQERSPGMLRWIAPIRHVLGIWNLDPELEAELAVLEPPLSVWGEASCTWVCQPIYTKAGGVGAPHTD